MAELVGRQVEVKALAAACARAAREKKVIAVLVEGAPGMGKTRLLREGLELQPIGVRVHVTGYEPESDLPFAVGRELIAALIRSSPEARDSLAPVIQATTREDPLAWPAVFEAAHLAVSAGPALVIAVDDFQWSDHQSTALLHYLIRGADEEDVPVAFVIAGRPSKPISVLAPSLHRLLGNRLTRIALDPLDEQSALKLARSANPLLDRAAAKRVAIRSQGSPFWCELLATAGDPEGDVGRIVGDALAPLSRDAASAFVTVVLLARPVHIDEIAQIHNWTLERAHIAEEQLTPTPLIVRHGDTIQVAHDLVRDASHRHIPAAACLRVHRSIATWLDGHPENDVTLLLSAARHRKAAGLDHAETIRRIFKSSTRRFVGRDGLETILELVDALPPDHPQEVELQHGAATLASELGQHSVALARWYAVADRLGDPVERARAWLAASDAAQYLERPEEARACLARSRRGDAIDPTLSIEIDAADAAIARWLEHQPDQARRLTAAALQQARTLASSATSSAHADGRFHAAYLRVLTLASVDAMQRNAPAEILPLTDEMDAVAKHLGATASVEAGLRTGSALMLLGRLREAEDRLGPAWMSARRAFLPDHALDVGSWLVWTRYLRGRLQEAYEAAIECSTLAARTGEESRPAKIASVWSKVIQISCGDRDAALDALRAICREEMDPHHRIIVHESIARWSARIYEAAAADDVRASLRAGLADAETARCDRCSSQFNLAAVEALVRIGATDEAAQWMQLRGASQARTLLEKWNITRATASLAQEGDGRHQSTTLRDAVETADRIGLGLEAIWARLDLGKTIAQSDSGAAIAILQDARGLAENAGAILEEQLAGRYLRRLGVRTWRRGRAEPPREGLHSLTEREREIARLVTDGATNPQIAQSLFLSRKTVERHVSNIFSKLGVKNRAELAARMAAAWRTDESDSKA